MIKIAICDDEELFIKELKSCINRYMSETDKEIRIFEYHDGKELLQDYKTDLDLIFMDIKMEKLNGLKTAVPLFLNQC